MAAQERREDEELAELATLLEPVPDEEYAKTRERLGRARDLFHDLLGRRFAEPFNRHLESLPQLTLAEKQELAKTANAELRTLGLAIRCPKTGAPAFLRGDMGQNRERGRFQLMIPERSTPTKSFVKLAQLELVGRTRYLHAGLDRWERWHQGRSR